MDFSFFLALALGQFVAFAIIMPCFNKKWGEGLGKGIIAVIISLIFGYIYVTFETKHRRQELIDAIHQQLVEDAQKPVEYPVKFKPE
jgi:hypothetical protein